MGLFRLAIKVTMADAEQAAELKKRRTFRKFTYRGVDLDQLLDMNNEQLMELFPCRIRRKFGRGLKRKPMALIKKLRKKKKEAPPNEKPDVVKTQLRNMVIVLANFQSHTSLLNTVDLVLVPPPLQDLFH